MPIDHATIHRSALKPLPLKVSHQQYEKLKQIRALDGLSIQEHIRRAIDIYLEREHAPPEQKPSQPVIVPIPAPVTRTKVRMR